MCLRLVSTILIPNSSNLILQGLSQATLANLPPIHGLYAGILASATYAFFGSSLQLTVGSTALISLMTGEIISKYKINYEEDLGLALDTAAQAAFTCGIIVAILGILNLGNTIRFVSQPVMSGFTTGAAMTIGLTQIRAAVGFELQSPQIGADVHYNYEIMEWWIDNWNGVNAQGYSYRNPIAAKVREIVHFSNIMPVCTL